MWMELVSNHLSDAKKIELAPIFLEYLCPDTIHLVSNKRNAAFPRLAYMTDGPITCIIRIMQITFYTYLLMKMEQTDCSETSVYKIQTPGNYVALCTVCV